MTVCYTAMDLHNYLFWAVFFETTENKMACLLIADCLNEIFENLEEDKPTLYSCLLVNRLWCKVSVRILWRDIWRFKYSFSYDRQTQVELLILCTLIACLPSESKELLEENEISAKTPTSKPSLFNYPSFCKALSIHEIGQMVDTSFKEVYIKSYRLKDGNILVAEEIVKMFMNQISSITKLSYKLRNGYMSHIPVPKNIPISISREANCLTDLSELRCTSDICSEFFHQLSRICHNLQLLSICIYNDKVSTELKEFITSQNNLKSLSLSIYNGNYFHDRSGFISALTKHSNTLTTLCLFVDRDYLPLSFISTFSNLQKIVLSYSENTCNDFKELQYVAFPKLKILEIPEFCPDPMYMKKFLEVNGKNLEEICLRVNNELPIAKLCSNLKKLFVIFDNDDEINILRDIFNNCQYLESIKFIVEDYII